MRRLVAGSPVNAGEFELIPVEATQLEGTALAGSVMVRAAKSPAAVVIRSHAGVWAFDVDGGGCPLEELLRDVAGLRELLERPR